jgi:hypothetical protein
LKTRSQTDKLDSIEQLTQQIAGWKRFSQEELEDTTREITDLEGADSSDSDDAVEELEAKKASLVHFHDKAGHLEQQLQTMKLNQIIKDIHTDEEAQAQIGMPDSVVDKVAHQAITNVRTEKKGKAQIGIFNSATGSGKGFWD